MASFRRNPEIRKFVKSDNVVRFGKNDYRTQCSLYSIPMTLKELCRYIKKEYQV